MTPTITPEVFRRSEGDWTVLRREDVDSLDLVRLAERNRGLRGNWKYVCEGPRDRVSLRLDLPEPGADAGESSDACESPDADDGVAIAPTEDWLNDAKRQLEGLGFLCHPREDRLVVQLDESQAEVFLESDGSTLCSIVFPMGESSEARRATSLFLLRVSASMRLVRGFASPAATKPEAGFMVRIPASSSGEFVQHAWTSLALCSRSFAKAVSVLQDQQTATAYLTVSVSTDHSKSKGEFQHADVNCQ
jgi:hypothetical protein